MTLIWVPLSQQLAVSLYVANTVPWIILVVCSLAFSSDFPQTSDGSDSLASPWFVL